jgi:hypothetical protein
MQPKEALIGGTINLGNYESFKFEFRGLVEKPEDYLDLAAFAAGSLLSQGAKADDEVRGKIRSFVGKVFGLPNEKIPDVRAVPKAADRAPAPEPTAPAAPKEEAPDRFDTGFPAKPLPKQEEKPAPAPAPEKKAVGAYTCEKCGKDITATQKQMSNLFLNKTLCKACMDQMTGKGVGA